MGAEVRTDLGRVLMPRRDTRGRSRSQDQENAPFHLKQGCQLSVFLEDPSNRRSKKIPALWDGDGYPSLAEDACRVQAQ